MRTLQTHNKVFGLGLSRTGTSSLTVALWRLGITTKHYPRDRRTYEQLRDGDYCLDILKTRFQALTDIPVVPYFAQLDQVWPGSKFILTVRDKDPWLRSVEQLWQASRKWWDGDQEYRQRAEFFRAAVYGSIWFNADRFSHVYDTHVRNVLYYFRDRPDDFLLLNVCAGDGWDKLCPFLGLDAPDELFPHAT